MYVSMYVCMHVCMYVCIYLSIDLSVSIYIYIYVCVCVMYVCACAPVYRVEKSFPILRMYSSHSGTVRLGHTILLVTKSKIEC